MTGKSRCACALGALVVTAMFGFARADDTPSTPKDEKGNKGTVTVPGTGGGKAAISDEGKLEEFKGKKLDLKEKGMAGFTLALEAGKKVSISVSSEKKSDINLFVYDAAKKEVAKDDSPGPDCQLTFTPKEAGKFMVVVRNLGPGANTSTVKAGLAK
jgi:hypothetical protein